ncbi:MAG: hypothetical protein PHP69_05735 [Candidatus Omnitrophica bacterium]|nr:hypothetical protein [Candidatus Omnitrophota bacterium]
MGFILEKDGDALEKETWNLFIKNYFPNYEKFWISFVVPRTKRPINIMAKANIHFDEKRIMMLHYTILNHLSFVFKNFSNPNQQYVSSQRNN